MPADYWRTERIRCYQPITRYENAFLLTYTYFIILNVSRQKIRNRRG